MAIETRPGSIFAGYRIVGTVGRGGMGVVYRARELALDRPVALKLIAPELASDPSFRERFLRESRIAASLDHPSVLPVYAAGEADGELYIATRFVDGTDLRTLIAREGTLAPERALRLLGQIAEALDAAHRHGLVHRDVKPGNVLVDASNHAYLCDFGLTKQLGDGATTGSGPLAGSLDYLAPEQIRRGHVDGRTDQYALGCVLYECLAGAPPFRRETEAQTLWAHMHEEPGPVGARPELDSVFARALAKEPLDRYASCAALVKEARSALGAESVQRRRRKGTWMVAIGAALLVAALLAVVALERARGEDKTRTVTVARNSVVAVDPSTNQVVAEIPVGNYPSNIAVADGFVWVVNGRDRTLSQISASEKRVVRTLGLDATALTLAAGLGAAWVTTTEGKLLRFDPSSGRVVQAPFVLRNPPFGSVAIGTRSVWVGHRRLLRIDPRTNRVVARIDARIDAPGIGSGVVAVGEGAVWLGYGGHPAHLVEIDPTTYSIGTPIPISVPVFGLAVGEGAVWTASTGPGGRQNGRVWRIDPHSGSLVSAFSVGAQPTRIAVGAGSVWVTSAVGGTLTRADPRSEEILARFELGATPTDLAIGEGLVWVAVG